MAPEVLVTPPRKVQPEGRRVFLRDRLVGSAQPEVAVFTRKEQERAGGVRG